MISEENGSLLDATADALVNTVNTVGVMGKGLALPHYPTASYHRGG
jgi:O-acetyl-ADP-ribose deacetylase (regulator of RNase III)